MGVAAAGQPRVLRDAVQTRLRREPQQAWSAWDKDEHEFQQRNLEAIRKYPLTPYTDLTPRALGSVSRAYYDSNTGRIYAGFNYPGVVAHVGSIDTTNGQVQKLVDIKGPMIYTVTSLAFDPDEQVLFYTTDNGAYRDIVRLNPATRQTEMLIKDRASATSPSIVPIGRSGASDT